MRELCPACGLRFEQEPGYFVGAMYFSYAMAVPIYALVLMAFHALFPGWPDPILLIVSVTLFTPCAPLIFRFSRLAWMHFDRRFGSRE